MNEFLFARPSLELDDSDRITILKSYSGLKNLPAQYLVNDFKGFFDYVSEELQQLSGLSSKIGIQTHDDLNQLVSHIRDRRTLPRKSEDLYSIFPALGEGTSFADVPSSTQCKKLLKDRHKFCSEEQRTNALKLALQLWLGIAIAPQLRFTAGTSKILWKEEQSLNQLIAEVFDVRQTCQVAERFPRSINVWSLEQIAGIRIVWTENLADHLRLTEDSFNPTVKLFRFPGLLQLHADSGSSSILPIELLEETLQTFALLIPCYSIECKRWFDKAQRSARKSLDLKARDQRLNDQSRNLLRFKHWGERLSIIKEAYDESEPRGFSQWWYDRRSFARWYGFWGAVVLVIFLTLIFGIISSVTGVMQVWAAYHPPG